MSDKIRSQHLQRKAILYVRQSSAYQVSHHVESQKLQYAMQERLQQLGWREVEVVDEELARVYQPKIKKMLRSRFWRGCEKSQVV